MEIFEIVTAHKLVSYETSVLACEEDKAKYANKESPVPAHKLAFPHIGT